MGAQFHAVSARFLDELDRSLPQAGREEVRYALRLVVGVIVAFFANATPRAERGDLDTTDVDAAVDRLLDFLVPGFLALAARPASTPRAGRRPSTPARIT
jgi:hypothetical protein